MFHINFLFAPNSVWHVLSLTFALMVSQSYKTLRQSEEELCNKAKQQAERRHKTDRKDDLFIYLFISLYFHDAVSFSCREFHHYEPEKYVFKVNNPDCCSVNKNKW